MCIHKHAHHSSVRSSICRLIPIHQLFIHLISTLFDVHLCAKGVMIKLPMSTKAKEAERKLAMAEGAFFDHEALPRGAE